MTVANYYVCIFLKIKINVFEMTILLDVESSSHNLKPAITVFHFLDFQLKLWNNGESILKAIYNVMSSKI